MSVLRRSEFKYPTLCDGLIARYCPSLTGPTGDLMSDLSGNNMGGTLQGGLPPADAWETLQGKYAIRFRGRFSNEEVRLPTNLLGELATTTNPLSYSQWFYNTGNFTSYSALQDNAGGRQVSIFLGPSATQLYVAWRGAAGGNVTVPFTMALNTWYHLCTTIDTAGTVSPYVNGQSCGTLGSGANWSSSSPIRIGVNPSGGGDNFFGSQDDIAIYSRVLSRSEITLLGEYRGIAYESNRRYTLPASVGGIVDESATSTIAFTSDATFTPLPLRRGETSTLAFTSDVTYTLPVRKVETSTLAFTSDATFTVEAFGTNKSASDTVVFTQTTTFFLLSDVFQVSQTLNFTDSVVAKGYQYDIGLLELTQIASFRIGIPLGGYFLTDTLILTEAIKRGQNYGVTDSLNLIDEGAVINPGVSSLELTQTVRLSYGKAISQLLSFTQTVSSESRYRRSTSHTNILQQAVGFYVVGVGKCGKATYSRFEGEGGDDGIPAQSRSGNYIPVAFESLTGAPSPVFIRAPEMDDKHRMAFDRVNRETRGGELSVFRDAVWPTTKSMLFTVVGVKTAILETLQAFLYSTLGQEVLFHDWTGVTWRGIVTNPEQVATEDSDGYWTVAFEFEGEPYEGPPANHSLAFSQTASFMIV